MNRIKLLREKYGLSQKELAQRANLSEGSISLYENGSRKPSYEVLLKFSEIFNCSIDYIVGKEDINLNDLNDKLFRIPILGRIPAGEPLLAEENIEGTLPIDPTIYHLNTPEGLFYLKVVGNSMNNIIKDGGYALIRQQDYAKSGDIIVAVVNGDNEATLKRFKDLDNGFIMLEPDSTDDNYKPLIINLRDTNFKILGKLIGIHQIWI